MKKLTLLIAFLTTLAGCKDVLTTEITTKNEFSAKEASYVLKKGNNTISGNAFMRQGGGGVVTCAGSDVTLLPITAYSKERIDTLYGDENFSSAYNLQYIRFVPEAPKEFREYSKKTVCNSSGDFEFKNVPNGKYYIQTNVVWNAGYSLQGGGLLATVDVKNGESVELVMSR